MYGYLSSESFKIEFEGSRLVDFPSRAASIDWESVNTATDEFFGTPVCNQCTTSSRPLFFLIVTSEAGTSPSYGLHKLGEVEFLLVTTTPAPPSIKSPDAEPSV